MTAKRWLSAPQSTAGVALLAALCAAGCSKQAPAPKEEKPAPAPSYTAVDYATAGSISGVVRLSGKAPAPVKIDMAQDPVCGLSGNITEQYVVKNGGLANVFVYVKSGLGNRVYAPPTAPVVLDQKGCRYAPHVVAVMVGQPVEFRNSDATRHNVHMESETSGSPPMDVTQPPGAGETQRTFSKPETMTPVRCAFHPWMQAFLNVAPNPFFAVTDAKGHFEIRGLPPGSYTVVAVHELMGEQTAQAAVATQKSTPLAFRFSPDAATAGR